MGADADTLDLLQRALALTVTPVTVTSPPAPLVDVVVESYEGAADKDGIFEGYGTAQFQLGNRYQGQWVRGKMHGQGTYQWSDGIMCGVCREMMFFERDRVPLDRFLGTSSVTSSSGVAGCSYSGDFHYNKCTGKGKMTWPDGSEYDGELVNGARHGFGTFSVRGPNGQTITYTGQWNQGVRHGQGKITYDDAGSRWYEGYWKDDLREGPGEMHYASGAHYKGEWVANVKSGFGTMTWEAERESYHGQWRDDRPHGEGTYLWQVLLPGTVEAARAQAAQAGRLSSVTAAASRGDLPLAQLAPHLHGINRYVGQFERGLRQGVGTFFYADGARYEGQWAANQKHGAGRFVYEDGSVYEGPFDRDRPVKPTQAGSAHGLVRLTCEDLLADEADPEGVRRALSNHLLREATELREIYRAAADPPSAQAVEWTLRPDVFGKLLRHAGALSPFLPLSEAMAVAEPAFDGGDKILFRQFLNALIRVSNALYRNLPRLDERFGAFLEKNVLPVLRGEGMDEIGEAVDNDPQVHAVFGEMAHIIQDLFPTRPEGTTVRHVVARLKHLGVVADPSELAATAGAGAGAGAQEEGEAEGAGARDEAAAEGGDAGAEGGAAAAENGGAKPDAPPAPPGPPADDPGGGNGWPTAPEGGEAPMEGLQPPPAEEEERPVSYPRKLSLEEAVELVMEACYDGRVKDTLAWAHRPEQRGPPPVDHFRLSGTVEPMQIYEIVARVAAATQNPGHPLPARIHVFLQGLAATRRATLIMGEESSAPAVVPAMLAPTGAELQAGGALRDSSRDDPEGGGGKPMLTSWPTGDT